MAGSSSPTSLGFNLQNIASNPLTQTLGAISPLGIFAADAGGILGSIRTPAANLAAPDSKSSTPTLAQTNTTALQKQLASESAAASTSSLLTSGQGLLDQPTTTSRVLLGS